MSRQNISKNDLGVAYASYCLIKNYKDSNGFPPSGLYFNKAMSYVHSKIREKGKNIMLPHCWYRWGDEVVRYYMPREIVWTHEEAGYTTVDWTGGPPSLGDDKLMAELEVLTNEFLSKYPVKNNGWYEELLADHYDGAPFEFQKAYKNCRDLLFDRTRSNDNEVNYANDTLVKVFKTALSTFPKDKLFLPVRDFIPAFLKLISYPLTGAGEDLFTANDISEEFWYWFSYYLRVHPHAHENIEEETVSYWKSELENETRRYYRNFNDHVARLSNKYKEISEDGLLVPHLNEGLKRMQDWEESMKDFDVEGLDDFLADKVVLGKSSDS